MFPFLIIQDYPGVEDDVDDEDNDEDDDDDDDDGHELGEKDLLYSF